MINVTQDQLKIIKRILQQHVPNCRVIAFGSRVKGTAKPFSDLDLCIIGDQELSLLQLSNLKEDFSESDLPFRIDIVDWNTVDSNFREIIHKHHEELI